MKKISVFIVMLASGVAVYAQNSPAIGSGADHKPLRTPMEVKTRFGIKGGVNLATFNVNNESYSNAAAAPNPNNKTSFHVGAFVNVPLGGMFRLQPELIYSGQGSKIGETINSSTGSRTYNYEEDLHYVNLPIMLQLQTPGGFFVETGPQLSYLIDAKTKGTTPISTENETDLDAVRDNFDIGWSAGAGYLTRIGLGVNARYNYGFRNIVKEDSNGNSIGDLENRVIQIGLVYHFGAYK